MVFVLLFSKHLVVTHIQISCYKSIAFDHTNENINFFFFFSNFFFFIFQRLVKSNEEDLKLEIFRDGSICSVLLIHARNSTPSHPHRKLEHFSKLLIFFHQVFVKSIDLLVYGLKEPNRCHSIANVIYYIILEYQAIF